MQGVKAKIHNGTYIYFTGDPTDIHFREGYANFTWNATLAIEGTLFLAGGTYLNNIFV